MSEREAVVKEVERGAVMRELEQICGEIGLSTNEVFLHSVLTDDYIGLGVKRGDDLIFARSIQPQTSKLAMLIYANEMQPVLLLGYDFLNHPIISQEFIRCPNACSFEFQINLKYCGIALIRDNSIIPL